MSVKIMQSKGGKAVAAFVILLLVAAIALSIYISSLDPDGNRQCDVSGQTGSSTGHQQQTPEGGNPRQTAFKSNGSVYFKNGEIMLNGTGFKILSGAVHYFRTVPRYWTDRLQKLKACGINTVETYVPWNLHEPNPGEFDFNGILDVRAFLKKAQDLGLYVIFRPGPYICSEWDFGGLPAHRPIPSYFGNFYRKWARRSEWGKRYYSDFCERSFADSGVNRKNHFKGVQHNRAKKHYYDAFRDASTILEEDALKLPCKRFYQGVYEYGDSCKFSHMTSELRQTLQERVAAEKADKERQLREEMKEPHLDEWLEKRQKRLQKGDEESKGTEPNADVQCELPPFLPVIPNFPPSLLPPTAEELRNKVQCDWG